MHTLRLLLAVVAIAAVVPAGRAADPLVLDLPDQVTVGRAVVTVGDVAGFVGGDAATRDWVARLDVAEFKGREATATVTRRVIEYRLRLAGIDPARVRVTGADQTIVTAARRAVTAEEVLAAARAEVLKRLAVAPDAATVEPVQPIAVRLPEVFAAEVVTVSAQPHARVTGFGRVQMDIAVCAGGEKVLSFAVTLDVKPAVRPAAGVVPAGAAAPAGGAPAGEILVRPRQRVTMVVRSGALSVSAVGEALQDGRLGQTILVQNVDSKKTLSARVTGPGAVDIELGGVP